MARRSRQVHSSEAAHESEGQNETEPVNPETQDAANKAESNDQENNPQTEQEASEGDRVNRHSVDKDDKKSAPKFKYLVNTYNGVYVDGKAVEVGKTVSFTHEEARRHTDAGISLTLDDEVERKRLVSVRAEHEASQVNDAPQPDEHV